jgi:hypothetical protein
VLSISQVYELPIGPGKKILNHGGAIMKNLLGGWSFSGHYSYASGTPVKITVNGRPLGFTTLNRANIMPGSFDISLPLRLRQMNSATVRAALVDFPHLVSAPDPCRRSQSGTGQWKGQTR